MANNSHHGFNGSRQAAWEFFGTELRRQREDAALTQVELGARVFVSGAYVGQFEQAIRKPQVDIAERIDEVLQTDGFFGRLCRKLVDSSRYASYFAAAADLEALATKICDFAPAVVPGLLQTPAYTRALVRTENPFATEEFVEKRSGPASTAVRSSKVWRGRRTGGSCTNAYCAFRSVDRP